MTVIFLPVVVGVIGMVRKGLERKLEELQIRGRIEYIQITVLTRSAKILCRVLQTRLGFTQTLVKSHLLKLLRKTLKEKIDIEQLNFGM